jgi:hypothetical protein
MAERVKKQSNQVLPKTEEAPQFPGAICAQWIRCGHPGCKCARGELHGPYYYRFWRDRGRQHKAYVRPGDLDAARTACEARRQQRKDNAQARRQARAAFALLRAIDRGDYSVAAWWAKRMHDGE